MVRARPAVSVLMPVRDARAWVDDSIADLRRQEGVELEVVAVDDGSVDGSREILARHAGEDSRIRVLSSGGRGPAAALNLALAESRAPLVGHMEADDRCPPHRFAALCSALASQPQWQAVTSCAEIFEAVTEGMQRYVSWQNSLLDPHALARARFVEIPALHQTGLYKRSVLESLSGWCEPQEWPLDIDFWMRFYAAGAVAGKVPEVLYAWRQHDEQSTRTSPRHRHDNLRRCKAHFFARGPATGRPVELFSTGRTLIDWSVELERQGVEFEPREHRPGWPIGPPSRALRLFVFGTPRARDRIVASPGFRPGEDWFAA